MLLASGDFPILFVSLLTVFLCLAPECIHNADALRHSLQRQYASAIRLCYFLAFSGAQRTLPAPISS